MSDVIEKLCNEIGLEESDFSNYVLDAQERVKKAKILKKDKTKREIIIPSWEIKIVQYWVIINYLRELPSSQSATAYYKGSSILKNASAHADGKYFVKVDIESFFTSLDVELFSSTLMRDNDKNPGNQTISGLLEATKNTSFLSALFYKGVCVIGYPASPYIANYILRVFDDKVLEKLNAESENIGRFAFTRYADDIVVSCQKKGQKKRIYKIIESTLAELFDQKLKLNSNKTKLTTRSGGSTLITGILVCPDGRLTLNRKYKDHVRLLFSLYAKGKLNEENCPSLVGHLNYIRSVDSVFYNKLYAKYYRQIKSLQ